MDCCCCSFGKYPAASIEIALIPLPLFISLLLLMMLPLILNETIECHFLPQTKIKEKIITKIYAQKENKTQNKYNTSDEEEKVYTL